LNSASLRISTGIELCVLEVVKPDANILPPEIVAASNLYSTDELSPALTQVPPVVVPPALSCQLYYELLVKANKDSAVIMTIASNLSDFNLKEMRL